MSRYIDADALKKAVYRSGADILTLIDDQPTADAEEIRHGTWYRGTERGVGYAKCSVCGKKMNYSCYGYARCALCGAKMDGERRETDGDG